MPMKKAEVIAVDEDGCYPDGFYRVRYHGEPGVGAVRKRRFSGGTPFELWRLMIHQQDNLDHSYSFDHRPAMLTVEKRLDYLP